MRFICGLPIATSASRIAIIVFVTLVTYLPAYRGDWLWDDDVLLTDNPAVQSGSLAGLYRIWVSPAGLDYFPLASTALWAQWPFFGKHPTGYHVTSVLLHVASALLLWQLLDRMRIPGGLARGARLRGPSGLRRIGRLDRGDQKHAPAAAGRRPLFVAVGLVAVAALAAASYRYAAVWHDEEAFWTYTLEHNPDAWMAHTRLGRRNLETGDPDTALRHFETALHLRPDLGMNHTYLGIALSRIDRHDESIRAYEQALRLATPSGRADAEAALARTGDRAGAIRQFRRALALKPGFKPASAGLARALRDESARPAP